MASRRVSFAISWLLAPCLGVAAGCYPSNSGRDIPLDKIYFPVGIAVSPANSWMYVANSDFDLQFNSGSIQVYDLAKLRALVPQYCLKDSDCADGQSCDTTGDDIDTGDGVLRRVAPTYRCVGPSHNPCEGLGKNFGHAARMQTAAEQVLTPGLCTAVEPTALDAVRIGPFATDLIYATNPLKDGKGGRLFAPVRGDATLHWIDVDDDTSYPDGTDHRTGVPLDCGQGGGETCDLDHRRGKQPEEENTQNLVLPSEPYGVALQARPYAGVPDTQGSQFAKAADGTLLTETSETLVTTHQSTGEVALFVNNWSPSASDDGPQLQNIVGGLPSGALSVAAVPLPAIWIEDPVRIQAPTGITYLPSFLTTFRNAPQVSLVRTFDDEGAQPAQPARPFIDASRSVRIATNSSGFDSRGIAIDSSARTECEAPETGQCTDPAGRFECLLKNCVPIPFDAYVANRTPASLVVGHTVAPPAQSLSDDLPQFTGMAPMSVGPSRVIVGDVIDTKGHRARRVFVLCFDSRRVFVFDPVALRFETEIITGRGPHSLAIDIDEKTGYAYGYIGLFSDSYIGVVDLDQRHVGTYGTFVLSVGQRTPPRASK